MRRSGFFYPAIAALVLGLLTAGCEQRSPPVPAEKGIKAAPDPALADDHSGWWCAEHGVPEEICAQCNARVAAEFQRKGDWCKEHNRPQSQCFVCDPNLEARFVAQYEARYGKKPPQRPASTP